MRSTPDVALFVLLTAGMICAPGCGASQRGTAKPVESAISAGDHDRRSDDPQWIEARKDVDWVLRKLARIEVDWDFVAPVERHGRIGAAVLVEEAGVGREYRREALRLLGCVGDDDSPEVLNALEKALQDVDADPKIRYTALQSLGHIGFGARSTLPLLKKLYHDTDWHPRGSEDESRYRLELVAGMLLGSSESGERGRGMYRPGDHRRGREWLQASGDSH